LNENPIFNPFRAFFLFFFYFSREKNKKNRTISKTNNKKTDSTNKQERVSSPQTRQLIFRPALFVISPFSHFVDFPRIQPIAYCMAALSPGFSFFLRPNK
jgi:hypothetical protein